MNHVDIEGSLAYILHGATEGSFLGEGVLVLIEEGEDDHDTDSAIEDAPDGFPQTEGDLVGEEDHHKEQKDESGHDVRGVHPSLYCFHVLPHQYAYAEEDEQTPILHAEIGEKGGTEGGSLYLDMGVAEEI